MLLRYLSPICIFMYSFLSASTSLAEISTVGSTEVFLENFSDFQDTQLNRPNSNVVDIPLGNVKGISTSFTGAAGILSLNLQTGDFKGNMTGFNNGTFSVWIADQPSDAPVSDLDSANLIKIATFQSSGDATGVSGKLDRTSLQNFHIDRVLVASGADSADEIIASGAMSVFQKLLYGSSSPAEITNIQANLSSLVPEVLQEITQEEVNLFTAQNSPNVTTETKSLDQLIALGEELFFNGRFGGNGRTCGTCHPKERNFTIDPEFIATLPASDPLFVAETNPDLAQLERPQLMRKFGLILENLDGLEDPTNKFVMRSVPHTLGMLQSLNQDTALTNPPAQMTGWSGDGAPGTGSLRDFAIGAVTQHFPKRLERVVGRDFVLPQNIELDALEAFQLSLGRTEDFDLSKITFLDAGVADGQDLFVNGTGDPDAGGRCNVCHRNAGAQVADGRNRNFNTNVEDVVHPARNVEDFPIDGGFGLDNNGDGGFGDRTFNTPPVVEAADTPPFFHNNVVDTLEGVVEFYMGPEFNNPRGPRGRFSFTPAQVSNIANFMRGINTLQNIDIASRELTEVQTVVRAPNQKVRGKLQSALSDSEDAIRVLKEGKIFPDAVVQLKIARFFIKQARNTNNSFVRKFLVNRAIKRLLKAKERVATIAP